MRRRYGHCNCGVYRRRHPRCSRTFPADLFENQQAYADFIVVGSLNDYNDHIDTLLGTELAIRQVDDNAGLEGTRFGIVHCDYAPMAGDALDWECEVNNTSDVALRYTNEVETGEMCNIWGESIGPLLNCVLYN